MGKIDRIAAALLGAIAAVIAMGVADIGYHVSVDSLWLQWFASCWR